MTLAVPSPQNRPRALRTAPEAPPPARLSPKPFTLAHFRAWASGCILDTGEPWYPEPFQDAFVEDLFSGVPECWLVVPEGNGKTTLVAGLALYHCEHRPFAAVSIAASSREQAEIMYRQAEGFVLRSERLYEQVHSAVQAAKGKRKTEVPRFLPLEGYRRINHHAGGRIQVFAADDRTGDGIIPTLGIIDEMHRHRDLALYRTWAGKLAKRKGQIVGISTAGERGSDFELTRERIRATAGDVTRRGSFLRAVAPRVVLHEWAVPESADPTDIAVVKAANPFSGVTVEMLAEKFDSATMLMDHWLRFVCNRTPDQPVDSWLGSNGRVLWDALEAPWQPIAGAPTWVGVDVGIKRDSTAVVAVQRGVDGHLHAWCQMWVPTEDQPVDATDVMGYLRELDRAYQVDAVSYDPRFFDVPAKMLTDEGLPMVKVDQSPERMTPICGALLELIKTGADRPGGLRHDGDEALATHVLNAVARLNDRGFTLAKSKSRGHIDGVIALALAVDRALHPEPPTNMVPLLAWA